MSSKPPDLNRRAFIRQACCAAVGTTGMLSALSQLKAIGAIAADSGSVRRAAADANYKALVCLFLNGGNDGNNLLIPYDQSSYSGYAAARGTVAIARDNVLPIATRQYVDGRSYGLNADAAEIKVLYDQRKIAFLANVGTLVRPTSLADYQSGKALPNQLYSHLDQLVQWQSSLPDQSFQTGWGGRLADLLTSLNINNQISMSLTVGSGANYFQIGNAVSPYVVKTNGAEVLSGYNSAGASGARYADIKRIMGNGNANVLGSSFADTTKDAITASEFMTVALGGAATLSTPFPANYTGDRLKMVAKLISIAPSLGLKRQIFFIDIGGYDTHAVQAPAHSVLLKELSGVMGAFHKATVELGVENQVTTFTASDFGRTYTSNSGGTDHGWGNHQMIMGGAVQGGDIYGRMPSLAVNAEDDTGRGRWIPSTSVDEYNATLARWFGVSDANLPVVLPNIGRFAKRDLGFMV